MKPASFTYLDPPSLDEVLETLATHGDEAAVLSGGQSLLPLMNLRLARPEVVVDPRHLRELRQIDVTVDGVEVGALVSASELLEDDRVGAALPGLVEAVGCIGHSQIRNRTTIGGSIAHADPAAELPAVLLGLDGDVVLRATDRTRRVPAAEWFDGAFSTTRRPDELVTAVRFPIPGGRTGWAEMVRRPGDFALVGLFASLAVDRGAVVSTARLAFSGLSDRPVRATGAEAALTGRPLDRSAFEAGAAALGNEITPADDLHASGAHRSALAATLMRRLLPRLTAPQPPLRRSRHPARRPTTAALPTDDQPHRDRPIPPMATKPPDQQRTVTVAVNGTERHLTVESRTLLSDALRHDLGLTGTHVGCEQGACGACTVVVDERPVRSCLVLAVQAGGSSVRTIEGVADHGSLHAVQQALHERHGLQCGFCTPGIVMSLVAAADRGAPLADVLDDVLGGHLCRCTGYVNIRAAVTEAWAALDQPPASHGQASAPEALGPATPAAPSDAPKGEMP